MAIKLDVDSLRALKSVVDCGGVTKAAQHLSLSQSAVSHKIRRLEESIDCVLLTRLAGGPLLTETGERLLGYGARILTLHDEAVASLSKRTVTGSIRLGMTEDMSSSGLARILAQFARLYPDVSVRTHVAQSMVLQKELEDGSVDLGAMQVFANDVRREDVLLFKNNLRWAKARDFQVPTDAAIPFLAYDDYCFYKVWLLENAPSCAHQFKTIVTCANNAGIIAGIEAGLGISIVNEAHISPAMVTLVDGFATPPEIAYIVRVSSRVKSHAVKALAGEIVRESAEGTRLKVA